MWSLGLLLLALLAAPTASSNPEVLFHNLTCNYRPPPLPQQFDCTPDYCAHDYLCNAYIADGGGCLYGSELPDDFRDEGFVNYLLKERRGQCSGRELRDDCLADPSFQFSPFTPCEGLFPEYRLQNWRDWLPHYAEGAVVSKVRVELSYAVGRLKKTTTTEENYWNGTHTITLFFTETDSCQWYDEASSAYPCPSAGLQVFCMYGWLCPFPIPTDPSAMPSSLTKITSTGKRDLILTPQQPDYLVCPCPCPCPLSPVPCPLVL